MKKNARKQIVEHIQTFTLFFDESQLFCACRVKDTVIQKCCNGFIGG